MTKKAEASAAGSALVGRRYAKMTALERSEAASRAASAPWKGLNADERRKEVKRRMAGKKKAEAEAEAKKKAKKKPAKKAKKKAA